MSRFGLADPRMDAVGYRTLMLDVLAESYYRQENILRDMIGSCFRPPITASFAKWDNHHFCP